LPTPKALRRNPFFIRVVMQADSAVSLLGASMS